MEKQEQAKPVRGQNLLEWYEALISAALVLVLGGGIGNVIDRVCRGYVVDMFDLLFIDYPIFNLADCFVVIGVVLGAVYYLWFYDKYDKKEPKDDAASES